MLEHGWEQEPYAFIHPWREMAGSGTIGLEILEDCPDVRTIFVPIGGGGLSGGVSSAIKALRPDVRIVGVEPEGCPTLRASLDAGRPVQVECHTFCDGVAVPIVIPEVFEVLSRLLDDVVLVSDDAVKSAVKRLALRNKLVVEGSGALAVAAALAMPAEQRGTSVCIVTGGSINPDLLTSIINDPAIV
jgi:threonine dehydratase